MPVELISDDDRSIAANSWSIKSDYGSTLDDEQCHADTAEVLAAAGPFHAASDYSSDKEPDANEVEPSMLGLQSYWDATYAEDLANFREHGHTGEVWYETKDHVGVFVENCLETVKEAEGLLGYSVDTFSEFVLTSQMAHVLLELHYLHHSHLLAHWELLLPYMLIS